MAKIDDLRKKINSLDEELMKLLDERFNCTEEIGQYKIKNNLPIDDRNREEDILSQTYNYQHDIALKKCYQKIFDVSKKIQKYQSYLLGGDTSYSLSPFIHQQFGNEYYQCLNYSLSTFLKQPNIHFKALNITNPFKKDAYEYCQNHQIELDYLAQKTQVTNFLVYHDGKIKGFNTDYLGFKGLIKHYKINLSSHNIVIIGNGDTSKTIQTYLEDHQISFQVAARTIRNSTTNGSKEITFEQVNRQTTSLLINTTSYNVYPNLETESLIDLVPFKNLKYYLDVNYNPLRSTTIVSNHYPFKIINGLYMLIEQARIAEEMIQNCQIDPKDNYQIFQSIYQNNLNIVLIGMPFSGKTTIAQKLGTILDKKVFDSDIILAEEKLNLARVLNTGQTLADYRNYENMIINNLALVDGAIISTGGGVIENRDNITKLKQNGLIIFINTPINILEKRIVQDRPLVKDAADLKHLYSKRIKQYQESADIIVDGSRNIDQIIKEIVGKINEYINNQWS